MCWPQAEKACLSAVDVSSVNVAIETSEIQYDNGAAAAQLYTAFR